MGKIINEEWWKLSDNHSENVIELVKKRVVVSSNNGITLSPLFYSLVNRAILRDINILENFNEDSVLILIEWVGKILELTELATKILGVLATQYKNAIKSTFFVNYPQIQKLLAPGLLSDSGNVKIHRICRICGLVSAEERKREEVCLEEYSKVSFKCGGVVYEDFDFNCGEHTEN